MLRLGVVSFLNSRPLIAGLRDRPDVQCVFAVPAALPGLLACGAVDTALVPTVDILRARGELQVISDACIGCDGPTLTVRVFSRIPPQHVRTMLADMDSHTSVALVRVLWREVYGCELSLRPCDARRESLSNAEAVLLIGDKVVQPHRPEFTHEIDLGELWRRHTGLPFVFAVWAVRSDPGCTPVAAGLAALLGAARDRGVARAAEIAAADAPALGWPVDLARRYLTEFLRFNLDARAIAGADRFAQLCAAAGLVPRDATIPWPCAAPKATPTPHGSLA